MCIYLLVLSFISFSDFLRSLPDTVEDDEADGYRRASWEVDELDPEILKIIFHKNCDTAQIVS